MPAGTPITDPYENFRFRVKWDGRYIAGVSKVSALKRSTEVLVESTGGDPGSGRRLPGRTTFDPILFERGVTDDTAFEDWANQVWSFNGPSAPGNDFRKNLTIELYNEAGQLVRAYKLYRCWVSEYTALPDLDGSAAAICFESILLENEGWERDTSVVAPPPQP